MPVLSQIVDEAHHVHTHVAFRDVLQSRETSEQEVLRRLAMSDKPFDIGRCQLDQSPKKVPLLSVPLHARVPRALRGIPTSRRSCRDRFHKGTRLPVAIAREGAGPASLLPARKNVPAGRDEDAVSGRR